MTLRSTYVASPIENATAEVIRQLNAACEDAHRNHGLTVPLPTFKRILALYLSGKSDEAMCDVFNIAPPDTGGGPRERKDSIGE
jgi:hypothetical protein